MRESASWHARFTDAATRLAARPDPDWSRGTALSPAVAASLATFQIGESGDGAHLLDQADATGDAEYAAAVRLFVAEEENHARLLAELLSAAGYDVLQRHWTEVSFVWVRRMLGLRTELMVLTIAEVIALRYYRALAEGTDDALLGEVATRILDDERRHVPFQVHRLRAEFACSPVALRLVARHLWRMAALVVTVVVAVDHGPALRDLRVGRREFVADTRRLFAPVVADVFSRRPRRGVSDDDPRDRRTIA
ncbi:MAG: ferritin-like domain-containing protein [Gordonia sp. (in: high G+C Gram-positive bacteria)]